MEIPDAIFSTLDPIIPFPSPLVLIGNYCFLTLAILSLLLTAPILIANIGRGISARETIAISLCLAGLLNSLFYIAITSMNLFRGGWSIGIIGCLISTTIQIFVFGISMSHATLFAIERYGSVIHKITLTKSQAKFAVISSWISVLAISLLPVYSQTWVQTVRLAPSMIQCTPSWHSSINIARLASFTAVITLIGSSFFIIFVYTRISLWTESNKYRSQKVATSRKQLLLKSAAISASFSILWTPYAALIIHDMTSGQAASELFDVLAVLLAMLNSVLTPIILLTLDDPSKYNIFGWTSGQRPAAITRKYTEESADSILEEVDKNNEGSTIRNK